MNVITLQVEKYIGGSILVMFNCKLPLIVCDRPGFDMDIRGYPMYVIPLKPDAFVVLETASSSEQRGLVWQEDPGAHQCVQMVNNFTLQRARKWVVAKSREQLEALRSQLTPDILKERISKDDIKFTPLDDSTKNRSWRLRKTYVFDE